MDLCKEGEHCDHRQGWRGYVRCCRCSRVELKTSRRDLLVWATVGTAAVVTGRWLGVQGQVDSRATELPSSDTREVLAAHIKRLRVQIERDRDTADKLERYLKRQPAV